MRTVFMAARLAAVCAVQFGCSACSGSNPQAPNPAPMVAQGTGVYGSEADLMKLMDKWSGALAATGKVSLVHASREGGSCSVALSASEVEALKLKIAEERASGVVMTDFEHAGWRMMHWRVWVQVQAESGGAERLVLPEIMEAIPEVARAFVSTCLAQGLRATGVESLSPEEAGVAIAEFEGVLGEAVVRSVREQTEGGQPKAVLKALVQAVQEGDREMKWNAIAKVFERGASNVAVFGRITVRR